MHTCEAAPTFRVVILHGEDLAAGLPGVFDERVPVDGFDREEVQHADVDPALCQAVSSLLDLDQRHARPNHRHLVGGTLAHHLHDINNV